VQFQSQAVRISLAGKAAQMGQKSISVSGHKQATNIMEQKTGNMEPCSCNYAPESFLSGQLMLMLNSAPVYFPAPDASGPCRLQVAPS